MDLLNEINENLISGSSSEIRNNVKVALGKEISYEDILNSMLKTMEIVGDKFKNNIIFVPEVLIIGRAFNVALQEIAPYIKKNNIQIGTLVIGTVQGDHHDIGKNLVRIFLESVNIKVIDLGVNVSSQKFINAIKEHNPQVVAMSALLTTTMIEMEKVITNIEESMLRDDLKIIIGGAPVTQSFATNIGADYYAANAFSATEIVKKYLINK